MGIGGVVVYIGVSEIGSAVVGAFPTIDKTVKIDATSGSVLKIFEIGQ